MSENNQCLVLHAEYEEAFLDNFFDSFDYIVNDETWDKIDLFGSILTYKFAENNRLAARFITIGKNPNGNICRCIYLDNKFSKKGKIEL